jgi:KaiC/GvpD/RAD55 family RecA-like ATPase
MVTMFSDITSVTNYRVVELKTVLDGIRNGHYKERIIPIRTTENPEEKRRLKSKLPCVLFCGEFTNGVEKERDGAKYISYRDDRSLKKHSGYVPIDIDHVEDIVSKKEELMQHPFIYALWVSASGRGIHGLVKIGDTNKHSQHYKALISKLPEIDKTAQNPSRVLYVSYDPELYINESCETFFDVENEQKQATVYSMGDGGTDYRKIDIACRMIRGAKDGEKYHVLLKAAYLMGGFIATRKVEYDIAYQILRHEITKRDIKDIAIAEKGIRDGLNAGMLLPAEDMEVRFEEAIDMIGIEEEDLKFLTDNKLDEEYIHKFRLGLIPQGLPLGHARLDEHVLLKEGEFYAILGHSHIGKSTLTLWFLFLAAINHGWNFMVYCGENSSASVKIKLMQFLLGKRIQKFTEPEQRLALKFVDEHFFIMSSNELYSYKDILSHANKLLEYKSIKGVFIDPYNSLKMESSGKDNKYIYDYEAYSAMLTFTKKYTTSLFLSCHTTTGAQREKDSQGNQVMPHATDAEGGSALYNRCDNFITIHRKIKDNNEFMFTQVSIDKVRNDDTGGRPTPRSEPVILKMIDKVEFVDEDGSSPFNRDLELLKLGYKL